MKSHGAWILGALLAALLPVAQALAGPVNVNTADARTIAKELQGIGPAKAQAIVAHREKHGPFRSLDELAKVKGIGRKVVDANRDNIRLDARGAAKTAEAGAAAGESDGGSAPARRSKPAEPRDEGGREGRP